MKKERKETIKGIELQNHESIRIVWKNYKYFGISEADIIKQKWKKK